MILVRHRPPRSSQGKRQVSQVLGALNLPLDDLAENTDAQGWLPLQRTSHSVSMVTGDIQLRLRWVRVGPLEGRSPPLPTFPPPHSQLPSPLSLSFETCLVSKGGVVVQRALVYKMRSS